MSTLRALVGVAVSVCACGGSPMLPANGAGDDDAAQIGKLLTLEEEVLRDLAAIDRRIAARARIEPTDEDLRRVNMAAVLAEDATLAVVDNAIDPFSFEARARGLAAAKAKLERAPSRLPASAPGMVAAPALERELLARLVDEETARLEEERSLPRSASALVRAIVETWAPPRGVDPTAARDRWLARRLGEVKTALATTALDVVRARELDDALDALEHAIDAPGFGAATAELLKLRETLEAQGSRPPAGPTSDWGELARRARAHLGWTESPEALDARLASLEAALRAAATEAVARSRASEDALFSRAAALVFAGGPPCTSAVPGSIVRSMAAPPEREAPCRLRQAAASASDDDARAATLVAMHEYVIVARWALDVARGASTIAEATAKHRPMSRPTPDVTARWERVALARPTAAIAGGLAAEVLRADPPRRAKAWMDLGEVPMDVAERLLPK
ncbi:MAG: hypothetical protein KF819_25835 [Labilithrix sp.]|nr:hypothetical protein [Labilithrix sp.]